MDRNPRFGDDLRFAEGARRVTDLLWENTGGDTAQFPQSYLETLRHDYSDGRVSMLELIDRVDLGPRATYEDYCEVVEKLMAVDSDLWPNPQSVVQVQTSKLLYTVEPEFSEFDEFDFAEDGEDMSHKVESFLRKVISSIYTDGVTDVSDSEGNPPGENNNYLLSEDGEEFHGVFHDRGSKGEKKEYPFRITNNGGNWQIEY